MGLGPVEHHGTVLFGEEGGSAPARPVLIRSSLTRQLPAAVRAAAGNAFDAFDVFAKTEAVDEMPADLSFDIAEGGRWLDHTGEMATFLSPDKGGTVANSRESHMKRAQCGQPISVVQLCTQTLQRVHAEALLDFVFGHGCISRDSARVGLGGYGDHPTDNQGNKENGKCVGDVVTHDLTTQHLATRLRGAPYGAWRVLSNHLILGYQGEQKVKDDPKTDRNTDFGCVEINLDCRRIAKIDGRNRRSQL